MNSARRGWWSSAQLAESLRSLYEALGSSLCTTQNWNREAQAGYPRLLRGHPGLLGKARETDGAIPPCESSVRMAVAAHREGQVGIHPNWKNLRLVLNCVQLSSGAPGSFSHGKLRLEERPRGRPGCALQIRVRSRYPVPPGTSGSRCSEATSARR